MKKLTIQQKRSIYCIIHGHSKIIESSLGYIYCFRCGDQIGDALGGYFKLADYVIVGHKCDVCRKNFKKLSKYDKVHIPRSKLNELREDQK